MMLKKKFKNIISMLLYSSIFTEIAGAAKVDNGNPVIKPSDKPTVDQQDLLIIKNQKIDQNFLLKITANRETKILIMMNCDILTNLDVSGLDFVLIDCNFKNQNGSYVEINSGDGSIILHKITFFSRLVKHIKYLSPYNITSIQFDDCSFDSDQIDIMKKFIINIVTQQKVKQNKKIVTSLRLINCDLSSDQQVFMKAFNELSKIYNFSLEIRKQQVAAISSHVFSMPQTQAHNQKEDDDEVAETQDDNGPENEKNPKLPKTLEKLKAELVKRSDYIPEKSVNEIIKIYKKIKPKNKISVKKEEDENEFYKTQILTIMDIPCNAKIRQDIKVDDISLLVTKIFRELFPSGLDEVLTSFINMMKTAVLTGNVSSRNNNILYDGPPGVGKSSLVKIIAMLFALLASNNDTLSVKTIHNALHNAKDFDNLMEYLEKNYIKHMSIIPLNGVDDAAFLRGVQHVYMGSNLGKIVKGLLGLVSPIVVLLDEIDKMGYQKNGGGNNKNKGTIGDSILNLFDGQDWQDYYLEIPLSLRANILFQGTSNVFTKIDDTLRDRFVKRNIPPNAAEGKLIIIVQIFANLCFKDNLIKNKKDFTFVKNIYKMGPISIDVAVFQYLVKVTKKADGLRSVKALVEELFSNILVEYIHNKKPIHIDMSNVFQFITVNHIFGDEDNSQAEKSLVPMMYKGEDTGNNNIEFIYSMKNKSHQHSLHIIGGNQEKYYLYQDLVLFVESILKNISSLCPSISSKFGLSLVPQYFNNQQGGLLYQIPSDASTDEYKHQTAILLIISGIATIRDFKIKPGVLVIGKLLPNGDFVAGDIDYQNKIIASTKYPYVKELILPVGLSQSIPFKNLLNKLNINHLKFIYAKNLSEVLNNVLCTND